MSPLVSTPNRGYSDYQRIDNYDTGVIIDESIPVQTAPVLSSVADVSRYASLAGLATASVGLMSMEFDYYSDSALSDLVSTRKIQLVDQIQPGAQLHFLNLGPFLQVKFSSTAGANYSGGALLFATNRIHPLDIIPQLSELIDIQNAGIGAGTIATTYPNAYYAGPAAVGAYCTVAGAILTLRTLSPLGTWDIFDQLPPLPANTWQRFTTVLPPSAWRAEFNNPGAAANYYTTVVPSTTGAT